MKNKYLIIAVFNMLLITKITEISAQDFVSRHFDEGRCIDPDRFPGVCKPLKECAVILSEFMAKSNDEAYIQYLRQSNNACHNMKPFVCCPPDGRKNQIPEQNIVGRLLKPTEGCGFSNQELRLKLAIGHQSKLGAFPWMTLIGYTNNMSVTTWECGGTLITTRHVLTAARCITPNLSVVRLGEHIINATTKRGVEDVRIVRSDKHSDYNARDGSNDIAILFLERDINISPHIRPICLPISDPIRSRDFVNYQPFVAGWSRNGANFDVLHEASLPVLENDLCKQRYREQHKLISESQFSNAVICAGILTGDRDNCISDIGGPLIQPIFDREFEEFRYYLIGVASGIACIQNDTPGLYTRVQQFVYWIQDKVNGVY